MYTIESTRRRINKIGAEAFIKRLFTATFSSEQKRALEDLHILEDDIPNLSLIYFLAQ